MALSTRWYPNSNRSLGFRNILYEGCSKCTYFTWVLAVSSWRDRLSSSGLPKPAWSPAGLGGMWWTFRTLGLGGRSWVTGGMPRKEILTSFLIFCFSSAMKWKGLLYHMITSGHTMLPQQQGDIPIRWNLQRCWLNKPFLRFSWQSRRFVSDGKLGNWRTNRALQREQPALLEPSAPAGHSEAFGS